MPVHCGGPPQVMLVAQEVDQIAILPEDGTQISAPEFVLPMFSQLLPKFLVVELVAWHDGALCQNSQFILRQVEEHNRFVKMIHEEPVVLVGNTACGSKEVSMAVPYPASVDFFCVEVAACLGLA